MLLEVKKSERGVRGGQGKAKIAQKRVILTQKRPKIARMCKEVNITTKVSNFPDHFNFALCIKWVVIPVKVDVQHLPY